MKIVGISELALSTDPKDILITYSLGSCVGVSLYDPINKVGGLIHCMLPTAKNEKTKALEQPYMFVDTGLLNMINKMYELGAEKKNLICKVAGGAHALATNDVPFRIGDKNVAVLRMILEKNRIPIAAENVGGTIARTMFLRMDNGKVIIKNNGKDDYEL